jgi:excinuclease ABC subunit A
VSGRSFVCVELLFLPSFYAPCPTCKGARYNAKTLEIKIRDRSIADVLAMTVDGAFEFFADDVLDEPTTGLHPSDVEKLMTQLVGLVEAQNTVVVVEHDMSVAAASDWIIDIGPGAGDEGGTSRSGSSQGRRGRSPEPHGALSRGCLRNAPDRE